MGRYTPDSTVLHYVYNITVVLLGGFGSSFVHMYCMSIHCIHFHTVAGKRVRLKGFQGFRGGLDSEKDLTGEFSVQTEFAGLEIMFHVATLMPFDPNDPQQVNLGELHVQYSM